MIIRLISLLIANPLFKLIPAEIRLAKQQKRDRKDIFDIEGEEIIGFFTRSTAPLKFEELP